MSDITLAPAGVFTTELRAFHGQQEIKDRYLARVQAHRDADEIVKGVYWQHGKGCAVGCSVHSGSHVAYEIELGIPRIIARLEDGIFEGLPNAEAKAFPLQFLEAIPVGADLSQVWPTFCIWLLSDPTYGVRQYCKTDKQRAAFDRIVTLYQNGASERSEYRVGVGAADAYTYAYAADAYTYAYAADAYAAYAYAAYAYTYARQKHRLAQRDMLLKILAAVPVPVHATNI